MWLVKGIAAYIVFLLLLGLVVGVMAYIALPMFICLAVGSVIYIVLAFIIWAIIYGGSMNDPDRYNEEGSNDES